MRSTLPYAAGLMVCLVFAVLGLVLIPYPGAQYDEVAFVSAIHDPQNIECVVQLSFGLIPVMLMTYAGTLKSILYMPVMHWFSGTDATLRLPVLAMGTASIWMFYLAMRRLAGTKSALLAALLLATDAVYLITCVFDWGPVALQHLLCTALLYACVRYSQDPRVRWVFLLALCAGLALWEKALFLWLMAGFGAALLAVFPRELWQLVRRRWHLAVLVLGFMLGASPFLFYNTLKPLATFKANVNVEQQRASSKLIALDQTLDGGGLLGYIVKEQPEGPVQNLRMWEKIPLFLNDKLGNPRHSFQHLLLVAVLLLAPIVCWFGPFRRASLIFLLGGVLTYALMLVTRGAGDSAHHTILLWPIPQILLALLLAQIAELWPSRGWRIAAAVVIVCTLSNLTVLNTYLAHFIACGPEVLWSDAIRPLVYKLGQIPGRTVFAADWGITRQIEWYGAGRIGFHQRSDTLVMTLPDPTSATALERVLADPATLFVVHAEGREAFAGTRQKLLAFAAERGYQDSMTQSIQDRHGVTIFEIHEFRK